MLSRYPGSSGRIAVLFCCSTFAPVLCKMVSSFCHILLLKYGPCYHIIIITIFLIVHGTRCMCVEDILDEDDKEPAFLDMCKIITVNPGGIVPDFVIFCEAFESIERPSEELKEKFKNVIRCK